MARNKSLLAYRGTTCLALLPTVAKRITPHDGAKPVGPDSGGSAVMNRAVGMSTNRSAVVVVRID